MPFFEGTAPIDFGPPPPREPRYADPLNGEVIVRDIELPADVTLTRSGLQHFVLQAVEETQQMRETQGNKARCIQLHIHYPPTNRHYISHLTDADRERA